MDPAQLHQAIQLNNLGVYHLDCKNAFVPAERAFHDGISCLKQTLDVIQSSERVFLDGMQPTLIQVQRSMVNQSQSNATNLDSVPYFYSQPILLDETFCETHPNASPQDMAASCSQVGCILLFNFALSYHRQCSNRAEEGFREAAEQLYKMALRLLEPLVDTAPINQDGREESASWYKVLMVVLLNNCAELHYQEVCEYQKAQLELDYVKTLMTGEHDLFERTDLLSEDDLDGIVTNAVMLTTPVTARAA